MTKLEVSGVATIMTRTRDSNNIATKITPGVEERIVEVSLQNTDYGASRLVPLLEQEGITVTATAVYAILKRNDLHTRSKRLSKLEAKRAVETPPELASNAPSEAEQEDQVPAHIPTTKQQPHISPSIKALKKTSPRPPWALSVPNLLLLGIVGYFWASAIGNFLNASRQPLPLAPPPAAEVSSKPKANIRPLEDYKIITERNLFELSEGEASAPQEEEVSLEGLPVSLKVAGFKLLGTVASDDPVKSFAILHSPSTRKQELYREGDKVGQALLKKILRNKVVLNTAKGDEVLTMELKHSGESAKTSAASQRSAKSRPAAAGPRTISVSRAEVQAELGDVNKLIKQLKISPYVRKDQPPGFKIGKIAPESVLTKIGLRNGDVITGVNDVAITSSDQTAEFFQRLKEGGDVTIKVRRRRGVRRRAYTRLIHLNIE